jgi:hypothetical protein
MSRHLGMLSWRRESNPTGGLRVAEVRVDCAEPSETSEVMRATFSLRSWHTLHFRLRRQ